MKHQRWAVEFPQDDLVHLKYVALLKCNFLRDERTKPWTPGAQMKAKNLANAKLPLTTPIESSKPEI